MALAAVLFVFTGCDALSDDEHIHEWKEYGKTEPTCTEWGKRLDICTKCLETREVEVSPRMSHDLVEGEITVAPTCTKGKQEYICTRCGYTRIQYIAPAYAHSWDLGEITKEPTCTESGKRVYHCMGCDATRDLVIDALEHEYIPGDITKAPTCTETGKEKYVCTRCSSQWIKTLEKLDHAWDDGEVTKEPTCKKAGEKIYTCRDCPEIKTEVLNATGIHQWEITQRKEPTCETKGEIVYTCSGCASTQRRESGTLGGHKWDNGEVTAEPTCGDEGVRTYHCSQCTETKTKALDPTGEHTFEEGVCSVCAAPEYHYTKGLRFELSEDGLTYTVIDYIGTENAVVIPPYFRGKPVVTIGYEAFSSSGIEAVEIPETVTQIGEWAFSSCKQLKGVVIPSSVTSIGMSAFSACWGLTDIKIPTSVIRVGEYAFGYCYNLKTATFTEGSRCEVIGEGAFYRCDALESITIPFVGARKNFTSVWDGEFSSIFYYSLPSSLKTVVILGGNEIAQQAFMNCANITSIVLPSTVTSIGKEAFYGCKGLTSIIIPEAVTEIGSYAFLGCPLTSVTFEDTEGWYWGESRPIAVADPAKAAEYLTDTYADCIWKKEEVAEEDVDQCRPLPE